LVLGHWEYAIKALRLVVDAFLCHVGEECVVDGNIVWD
jgi:hypothetical protein